MTGSPEYNSLLKLMAALIRKNGGRVTLSAADLHDTEPAKGFTKRWDNDAKELVLEMVQYGTVLYMTGEGEIWNEKSGLGPTSSVQNSPSVSKNPLREGLDVQQLLQSLKAQGVEIVDPLVNQERVAQAAQHKVVTDQEAVRLERERSKSQALRDILEYQSPEPAGRGSRRDLLHVPIIEKDEQPLYPVSSRPPQSNAPPQQTPLPVSFFKESVRGS